MKSFFTVLSLFCVLSLVSSHVHQIDMAQLFDAWKIQYNRVYSSSLEEAQKFEAFVNNYQAIQAFNQEDNGAVLALNQFADMTSEEFGAHVQCLSPQSKDEIEKLPRLDLRLHGEELPSSVNWTAKGAVTSIKNQEQCGGCWAFAAAASLEGYEFLTTNNIQSLSEQQLIDCATQCEGCNGCDNLYNALVYTSKYGIESYNDYPFTGATGTCQYSKSKVVVQNSGYYNVQPKSVTQLETAIAQQPTIVGVQANQLVFQFYSSGVIKALCGDNVDHAITAVGYNTEGGSLAFYVKNSWGTTWGMNGYVWISASASANGGNGVCGILSSPVYPTKV